MELVASDQNQFKYTIRDLSEAWILVNGNEKMKLLNSK